MGSDSSPPPAPDPWQVAAAQTQSNRDTAITNANLNRYDQFGPQGSLTYQIVGTNPDGTPKYQSTAAYSPGEQQVYDSNLEARQNIGQAAVGATSELEKLLSTPFDGGQATADKIAALGRQRLDPQFQQQQATLEQSLANKGISVGTTAYQRAMDQFGKTRNDAYNQLYLNGQQQAWTQSMAERNQPLNEVAALLSGSQVTNPTLGPAQNTTQANADIGGIVNGAYKNQLDAYNAQQSQDNAMMGGIFGIGSSLISAGAKYGPAMVAALPFSDRRLKKDMKLVGHDPNGLDVYEWTYVWGGPRHRGYVAQDVEKLYPRAVHESDGFKKLDYSEIP